MSKGIYRSPAYVAGNEIIGIRVCEHFAALAARLLLALALVLTALLPHAAHAVPWDSLTLGVSPVVDAAQALKPEERAALDARLRAIHDKGLMQAAVVLVDSTDGEPIFDYGMKLAEKWKLGSADKNNGLLILIAIKDREYQTLTGTGLEGVLTDVSLTRIQRDAFTPNFKRRDYAAGINAALGEMERRLTVSPDTLKRLLAEDRKEIKGSFLDRLALIVAGLTFLSIVTSTLGEIFKIPHWLRPLLVGLCTGGAIFLLVKSPEGAVFWGICAALFSLFFERKMSSFDPKSIGSSGSGSSSSSHSSRTGSRGYRGGGGRFGGGGSRGRW